MGIVRDNAQTERYVHCMSKSNVFSRLKSSFRFFQHGWKYYQPRQLEQKRMPYVFPNWTLGQPQWHLIDYGGYAQEGFSENAIVYAALMYIYRASQAVPLRAYSGTFEKPEILKANHELQKLCMRPNRWQSWAEFQGLAEIYLNLAGNCYVYLDRNGREEIPKALYLLRPDRVYLIPGRNERDIIGYYHLPEGKGMMDGTPYLVNDIIHVKLPNPLDRYEGLGEGLSSLSPAARSIDVDNALTKFLKLFVDNGIMPLGLLSFDVPMEPGDMAATRERFMEIYGGWDNWAMPAVLDQGGKWQQIGSHIKDLDMGVMDARNESRAVSVFGVPLTLIETRPQLVSTTYDNKSTDRKMFWEDKMKPEIKAFQAEYQFYLQGPRGEFVAFDFSEVPSLTMTPQEKGEQAKEAFTGGGITRNEYRAVIGQDPADDGNVYLIPANVIETPYRTEQELAEQAIETVTPKPKQDETQEGMPEAEDEAAEDEAGSKSTKSLVLSTEQKAELWKKNDDFAISWEGDFGGLAVDAFEQDYKCISATITEQDKLSLENSASLEWPKVMIAIVSDCLAASLSRWADIFSKSLYNLMSGRATELNDQFGQAYPTADLLKQQWFSDYTIKFAQQINETTEATIRKMIEQAVDEGWSVPTMQKHLKQLFDQWMAGDLSPEDFEWFKDRMPDWRRELIARTETLRASNTVSHELYKAWGAPKKEWLGTMDNRIRPDHADANGQIVPIDQPFKVGGYSMMHPHDPTAPADQVCNCRCSEAPVW